MIKFRITKVNDWEDILDREVDILLCKFYYRDFTEGWMRPLLVSEGGFGSICAVHFWDEYIWYCEFGSLDGFTEEGSIF